MSEESTIVGISIFTKFTSLVTARDLQTLVGPSLPYELTIREAMQRMEEGGGPPHRAEICLVLKDDRPVGWVTWPILANEADDEEPDRKHCPHDHVADVMISISPGQLVSADTSALAVSRLVSADEDPLFVLDGSQVTGTLEYEDLSKPAFRVCLFSLLIQLEEDVQRLIAFDALENWRALSAARQEKAIVLFNQRHANAKYADLLGPSRPITVADVTNDYRARQLLSETMFIDKGVIVQKRGLVTVMTKGETKPLFVKAEKLRNACVHPGRFAASMPDRAEFWRFVSDVHRVLRFVDEQVSSDYERIVPASDLWP